jgi:hypothetical protein
MVTEAPDRRNPDKVNSERFTQSTLPLVAKPYPNAQEKATSIDSRGFNNSTNALTL